MVSGLFDANLAQLMQVARGSHESAVDTRNFEDRSADICRHREPTLYGVTDGKAVGTYFEHKFKSYLCEKYEFEEGSSASGIDFPELAVDMKVTSIKQPQSSCPFRSAQRFFGRQSDQLRQNS